MQINVNAAANGSLKKNFWNNVHFHPTDAVEDVWGQEVLNKFAQQKCAQYLRLYAMFEDIVTRDEEGKLGLFLSCGRTLCVPLEWRVLSRGTS